MHEQPSALIERGKRYWLPVYKPRELVLDHGKGARVWDTEGRDYVDFGAGIAVNALGHQDPDLLAALVAQAQKLWHSSNVFYTEPPLRLAEELVRASHFAERVFLCNSGAEANEAAIKLVRKWATSKGRAPEQRGILTFRGSFHGRTLATVTATAQPKYQAGYEPLPAGFGYADFNDVAALEAAFATGDIAAVMLEPVQGEGGVLPAAPGFLKRVRELCDQHDALLVQTAPSERRNNRCDAGRPEGGRGDAIRCARHHLRRQPDGGCGGPRRAGQAGLAGGADERGAAGERPARRAGPHQSRVAGIR